MDARYKINFSGEFKEWVERDEFIQAFSHHLSVSKKKAAALFDIDRKVNLKKNLTEAEADRHAAAFQKMGMLVTKKLMMKPFVGPHIELQSRAVTEEINEDSEFDSGVIEQGKKRLFSLTNGLKSMVNKGGVYKP
jgi:hypothetical protein